MIGMKSPSSYTSRASAERTWPPMSALWQVEAKKAMQSDPRKTGLQTVTSLRCPEVFHRDHRARADDGGGLALLHDGRPGETHAGAEPVTVVHRGLDVAPGFGKVGRALFLGSRRGGRN